MTDGGAATIGGDLGLDLGVLGRTLLEAAQAAGIGVLVTRIGPSEFRNLYVSETAARIFGRTVEEMLTLPPATHIAPQDRGWIQRAIADDEPPRASYELSIVRKDGVIVPVESTISIVPVEGRPAVVSFLADMTARRAAEEERARNEARFREVIEVAPEPIAILQGGRFVYVNRAYAEILGYEDREALYALDDLSAFLSPEELAVSRRRLALILAGIRVPRQIYRVRRRDGSEAEVDVSSILFEFQGKPAILAMGRDMTARKTLERQLVQADRLAAIGTLAAGVAHEINNPLAYVLLNLDWVARTLRTTRLDLPGMDGVLQMLADARHGIQQVAAIVRELKTFSRGDAEIRMPVDVQAVALSAIKIASHEVRQRATIRTEFQPAPLAWANDARLEQVIVNLLLNAAQAMPTDRNRGGEIVVAVGPTDDLRVALEVRDNGVGIPPEVLPRIFDPFFTTKADAAGTGLGLSICHGIVTSLGGTIAASSAPGGGTTFRVTLPAAEHDALTDEVSPDGATPLGSPSPIPGAYNAE